MREKDEIIIPGTKTTLQTKAGKIIIGGDLEVPLEIFVSMFNSNSRSASQPIENLVIEIGRKNNSAIYVGLRPVSEVGTAGCELPGLTLAGNTNGELCILAHNSCLPAINTLLTRFRISAKN